MGRFFVRITVIIIAVYYIYACYIAQYKGIDILYDYHPILFETIVVVYCFSEGKYHCKHIKHLSVAILLSDTLSRLDNHLDFLSVTAHNLIPIGILAFGIATSLTLAFRHFYKVIKLKRKRL